MSWSQIAAKIFFALSLIVSGFHLGMVFGAPWGEITMGGRWPGKLPIKLRVASVFQILLFIALTAIVLTRSQVIELIDPEFSRKAIWLVVGLMTIASILNGITPSHRERKIWGPIAIALLASSLIVALSN